MSKEDTKSEDTVEVISIPEQEPRKATDVLLSIEATLGELVKLLKVSTLNSNLTLARMNASGSKIDDIHTYIQTLKQEYVSPKSTNEDDSKLIASPTEIIPVSEGYIVNSRRKPAEDTEYFTDHTNNDPPPPKTIIKDDGRKVPVQQRITNAATGKDVFMAKIEVIDSNNNVVSKTSTNAVGRWQAHLHAGIYTVNITKTDTKTKNEIKASQRITIVDNGSTMTLPVAMIK